MKVGKQDVPSLKLAWKQTHSRQGKSFSLRLSSFTFQLTPNVKWKEVRVRESSAGFRLNLKVSGYSCAP